MRLASIPPAAYTATALLLILLPALASLLQAQHGDAVMAMESEKDAAEPTADRERAPGLRWIRGEPHMHEFSIWGGYAYDSHSLIGETDDVTLGVGGGRYNLRLLRWRRHLVEYSAEVSLFTRYRWPDDGRQRQLGGVGISPLGLQLNFISDRALQPYLRSTAGLMFLEAPFPDDRGTRVNFTFGVGGGAELYLSDFSSLSVGYYFFHLSNGETGSVNPGIDSSLFMGTLTLF
ncbi:MAG: acyloxyacyl hydrolase [Balneolaceae bacterium]|nr:acyloxyacyl hydrolase [Balneolaceae bacterium]